MPSGGGAARALVLAELGSLAHQEMTRPDLLEELRAELSYADNTGSGWLAAVRAYLHDCEKKSRIPSALDRELNATCSLAQQAWSRSRETRDASLFLPLLEKLIGLKRQEILCLSTNGIKGYDVLLDNYEPGMRCAELDPVFSRLQPALADILVLVNNRETRDQPNEFLHSFPQSAQEAYARDLLFRMGFDLSKGRLDSSSHPFTEGVAPGDVRLTSRYRAGNFLDSFFTVLHEGGHGLYEQGFADEWRWTPMAEAVSLGVHESQSRFWENCIGRSRDFWEGELPRAKKYFPGALDNASVDSILRHAQAVRPSLVRVEADEVTYNMHILLRYRMERALFSGDLQVSNLEFAWNSESEALLGILPDNPQNGYLQDVHWSAGLFGYFPTYTLGNLYAAQLQVALRTALPDFGDMVRRSDFHSILAWLRVHVHCHGRRFTAPELIKKATGSALDEQPFIEYLRTRYLGG